MFARFLTRVALWAASIRRRFFPADLAVMEMATAIWPALAMRAVIQTGIADSLYRAPATPEQLAEKLGLDSPSVGRVLRFLAGYDVVRFAADGRARLTRIGRQLARQQAANAAAFIKYTGEPWQLQPWMELHQALRTGTPAFELLYGARFFDYASEHREAGELFDEAMQSVAALHAEEVAKAYDFSAHSPVADIGGGSGSVLAAILEKYPGITGILFERPGTIARAKPALERFGSRVTFREGSFFETAPPEAGVYLLSHILHDWDDDDATRILRTLRTAVKRDARLLIVEMLLDDDPNRWSPGRLTDMQMLTILGGKERTQREFERLFAAADFKLVRVIPTSAPESILEAR